MGANAQICTKQETSMDAVRKIVNLVPRAVKATLNARVVPIIIVPGVMGTRLHMGRFNDRDYGAEVVWDPDHPTSDFRLLLLKSHAQVCEHMHYSRSSEPSERRLWKLPQEGYPDFCIQQRGWGEVIRNVYGGMLKYFADNQNWNGVYCPVFAVGYDWRCDIRREPSERLAQRIREIAGNDKQVILITHSMGGLVARWAIHKRQIRDKVLGVVHLVEPTVGAPLFYARCRHGAGDLLNGLKLSWNDSLWDIYTKVRDSDISMQELALWLIMGRSNEDFCRMISGMPGPVQLLPSDRYMPGLNDEEQRPRPWLRYYPNAPRPETVSYWGVRDPWDWQRSVWEAYREPTGNPGIMNHAEYESSATWRGVRDNLLNHLRAAEAFHRELERYEYPPTFALYGNGPHDGHNLATLVAVDSRFPVSREDTIYSHNCSMWYGNGDQTVPAASARFYLEGQRNGPYQFSFDVEHLACLDPTSRGGNVFYARIARCVQTLLGHRQPQKRYQTRQDRSPWDDHWITTTPPYEQSRGRRENWHPRISLLRRASIPDGDPKRLVARTGGIHWITIHRDPHDGSWHYKIYGQILPSIRRQGFEKQALPPPNDVGLGIRGGFGPYQRAHLWGPNWGDEAGAGIMYAPRALNLSWQASLEKLVREDLMQIAEQYDGRVYVKASAVSHPTGAGAPDDILQRGYEVLAHVKYEFEVKDRFGLRLGHGTPKSIKIPFPTPASQLAH